MKQEIQSSEAAVRDAMSLREEFLTVVSHELRDAAHDPRARGRGAGAGRQRGACSGYLDRELGPQGRADPFANGAARAAVRRDVGCGWRWLLRRFASRVSKSATSLRSSPASSSGSERSRDRRRNPCSSEWEPVRGKWDRVRVDRIVSPAPLERSQVRRRPAGRGRGRRRRRGRARYRGPRTVESVFP